MQCVVAIGVFDGVHRGHRALVGAAAEDARRRGLPCVVVTFDPDPADVLLGPKPLSHLLRTEDRVGLLRQAGADEVVCLPFTRELAETSWRGFAQDVLCGELDPVAVHVGSNFRFGRGGEGTPERLAEMGAELGERPDAEAEAEPQATMTGVPGEGLAKGHGFGVVTHDLLELGGEPVSSTRIRRLLRAGRVGEAGGLLGRAHLIRGSVAHGRGEGTGLGFPTANVVSDTVDCMPAEGVYAGWLVVDGTAWPAAINVGAPPTFDDSERPSFLEANLMGYAGDLYGREVAVCFAAWLRPTRKFDDVAELERVVGGNIAWVREHLGTEGRQLGDSGLWGLKAETTDAERALQ